MIEAVIQEILTQSPLPIALANTSVFMGVNPNDDGATNPTNQSWITHYRNSTMPHDTKTGENYTSNQNVGKSTLDTVSYQLNIYCYSATDLRSIATAVRGLLDRKSNFVGSDFDVQVQSIQFTNQVSLFEFEETYNTRGVFQINQYYDIRVVPKYQ